jgi:L-alanine-DL-glutamate epimerase-like enolase superfamily enzyme
MNAQPAARLKLHVDVEKWPFKAPFRITGYTFVHLNVIVVRLERDGAVGRGEAAGVYYRGDDIARMQGQLEAARPAIEAGVDRERLRSILPAGGARNAVDCALWDLEAKLAGKPAWQLAGLKALEPLLTTLTLGANPPEQLFEQARGYVGARAIKLKLTGEPIDADRVRAVRDSRPDVWFGVDANQGFTRAFLEEMMPLLLDMRVSLIEQPLKIGKEADLDGLRSPIPIAADESVQDSRDIAALAGRFNVINIKLDKCGGLTEAFTMADEARRHGLDVMVGNMGGTALAMAPGILIGQQCKVVDLDGPIFLREDRAPGTVYKDGSVWCPDSVWGGAQRVTSA